MKLWVLAGLFTLAAMPMAQASEAAIECGLETPQLLREVTIAAVETQAPVSRKGARPTREEAANATPREPANVTQRQAPQGDQRRRGGSLRRIPDALLIDGRGVL